jgi:hypothetical protein
MQVGVPPVATTIFFGANDAALLGRTSERQHVPVEEYRQNLRTIVNHLKVNFFSIYVLNSFKLLCWSCARPLLIHRICIGFV